MIGETKYNVVMEHMNGRTRHLILPSSKLDLMMDKLWGNDLVPWIENCNELINLKDIRYIRYTEIEGAGITTLSNILTNDRD